MMYKIKSLIQRFLRFFHSEENQLDEENISSNRSMKTNNDWQQNSETAKVIHKYPSSGPFRFPLNVDEPSPERLQKSVRKEPSMTIENATPYFQGRSFTVREVPSAVHGSKKLWQQRIDAEEKEKNEHVFEKESTLPEPNIINSNSDNMKEEDLNIEMVTSVDNLQSESSHIINNMKLDKGHMNSNPNEEREEIKKDISANQHVMERPEEVNVPYNVIMTSRDKNKSAKVNKSRESNYRYPPLHLLQVPFTRTNDNQEWVEEKINRLNETFQYFNTGAKVVHHTMGPSVTRFEIEPEPGVKVSKIVNLTDDLKLALAAKEIRIEAPIPGKRTIGIEVPNDQADPVFLREILRHQAFIHAASPLTVAMGKDIEGKPVVMDLAKMPHGLIAGATGSGKSVCVNSILMSILFKASPKEVRLLLIDPKMVELASYHSIPHLVTPVITDPKKATEGLKWAVNEMERRYEAFANYGARDLSRYNEKKRKEGKEEECMPLLVIVVDELADLMMVAPNDVEDAICRIAQKARACGIHLLVATQRPSVDVITGLIKANIPTRVAFSVASQADSRTILDGGGAERLLGKGDMLLSENGSSKAVRIQGTFVSDDEIDKVVEYVSFETESAFLFASEELEVVEGEQNSEDVLFEEVLSFVIEQGSASTSLLQRQFRIGYNRAARLIDDLEDGGYISGANGSKPRDVLMQAVSTSNDN